jgi:N-acetylglucosaminyldiphosphoundecaprenol N-acetyl-beta-D-mannosaminyltransferase
MSAADCMPPFARPFFGIRFSDIAGLRDTMHAIESVDVSTTHDFRYVVTPNADHILRIVERAPLRAIYNAAWLCLNDSRVLQLLLRLGGIDLPVVRGSDLAVELLSSPWMHDKRLVVIGGDERISRWLHSLPGPATVHHYNPPMGFIESAEAVDGVIDFIARHLPAVVFLAVGSPNQEIVADACVRRGLRGGIAFCVGAGILMAAGIERRAPPAFRYAGLEWLYRLARDPKRLAARYLRDVRILRIVAREVLWRRSAIQ